MINSITFGCGIAAKGNNGVNPSWMGRCWGYWIPKLEWNGGSIWKREVCDISLMWLCFHVGFILWPK